MGLLLVKLCLFFSNGTECARSVRPSVRLYVCSACVCEHLSTFRLRPYHDEHTRSRPITEVKNHLKNRH